MLCLVRLMIEVCMSFFTVSLSPLVLAHSDLLPCVFHDFDYKLFLPGSFSWGTDLPLD